jgi:hypothetical protein
MPGDHLTTHCDWCGSPTPAAWLDPCAPPSDAEVSTWWLCPVCVQAGAWRDAHEETP